LLCITISIDFNSQISFPLCQGVGYFGKSKLGIGVGNFGKVGSRSRIFWKFGVGIGNFGKSGVGYFTPQPCWQLNGLFQKMHKFLNVAFVERLLGLRVYKFLF